MSTLEERLQGVWHQHLEKLKRAEDELELDKLGLSFSVPRIVAIGEESCGKSSTLERLAMLEFFPRDRRQCTRMPIELRLRYRPAHKLPEEFKESGFVRMSLARSLESRIGEVRPVGPLSPAHVADQVKKWMGELVKEQNSELVGITKDRMVIELFSTRKLNLDLIDLPGIVAGSIRNEPSNMMDQTRELASSFINDPLHPHTFVIAVVSAAESRVRNSQAMELVQRYKKESMTIGVLTMADLSGDHRFSADPFFQLRERLAGDADDLPALDLGYIALVNRDNALGNQPALQDMANVEAEWFENHLHNMTEKCGISALTNKIVKMLETYTSEKWHLLEHARLSSEREMVRTQLKQLGHFIPGDIDELLLQTKKLIPESERIWKYDTIERCCAEICRLPQWAMGDSSFRRRNEICVNTSFSVSSQEVGGSQKMNGWLVHSQLPQASSPVKSPSPTQLLRFVFGQVTKEETQHQSKRIFTKSSWPNGTAHVFTKTACGDKGSQEGVDKLFRWYTNALASVPLETLIFCGKEDFRSPNCFVGIYCQAASQANVQIIEHIDGSRGRFMPDKIGTPQFSEKLRRFCEITLASENSTVAANNDLHISAQELGLPYVDHLIDLGACILKPASLRGSERYFVLMYPVTNNISTSLFLGHPVEVAMQCREGLNSIIEQGCHFIISGQVDKILCHISNCDPRFVTFHKALEKVLKEWCKDVTKSVLHRMETWLTCYFTVEGPDSLPIPTSQRIRQLFSQVSVQLKSFCNPLTIALSMAIRNTLQCHSLTAFIVSSAFKGSLLRLESEKNLCKENSEDERARLQQHLEALTCMLNVITEAFPADSSATIQ